MMSRKTTKRVRRKTVLQRILIIPQDCLFFRFGKIYNPYNEMIEVIVKTVKRR